MKLRFRTNLDEPKETMDLVDLNREANDRPDLIVPRVGERITFRFARDGQRDFSYELEVCSVAYDYRNGLVEVELHMPSYYASMSINEWAAWFKRHRLGRV